MIGDQAKEYHCCGKYMKREPLSTEKEVTDNGKSNNTMGKRKYRKRNAT